MGKFAQNKSVEVTAVAQAVTMRIAGQYASIRYRSENARTTMVISYRNMNGRDRKIADGIARDVLGKMKDQPSTKDLRCDVDAHIHGSESISVQYRTGIIDYGFQAASDGSYWFGRIKAA